MLEVEAIIDILMKSSMKVRIAITQNVGSQLAFQLHFNCMLDSVSDVSALHLSLKLKLNDAVSVHLFFLFL